MILFRFIAFALTELRAMYGGTWHTVGYEGPVVPQLSFLLLHVDFTDVDE